LLLFNDTKVRSRTSLRNPNLAEFSASGAIEAGIGEDFFYKNSFLTKAVLLTVVYAQLRSAYVLKDCRPRF